jgi:hypothetical protein
MYICMLTLVYTHNELYVPTWPKHVGVRCVYKLNLIYLCAFYYHYCRYLSVYMQFRVKIPVIMFFVDIVCDNNLHFNGIVGFKLEV